ncbi:hypothetical protein [Aquabacterium sp. CECT 9606]|uniref:hypothetical protein n=1 Tax=Aquabacterium sp. CECT 9606 TaxID=2845822 RepID=UPI001E356E6A|nr:hypothetical protein [Aquabacterium sp. CECT 9606]CAH0356206.1 hypothetical protein AQB9606_04614 [Aquabacterium sp. CECT 9606]
MRSITRHLGWLTAAALTLLSQTVQALPSYARQTGMTCAACHVGGFGPQLTPAGIKFKLGGYTDTDGQAGKVPLSAMVVASYTHTKDDVEPPADHLKSNDNLKMDEASIFLAGRMTDKIGTFVQVTHNGVDHSNSLDQMDIRLATATTLAGKDAILGITVNNNPGVQDPFNTMPTWGFPYVGPEAGHGMGEAATAIDGGFEQRVVGASAYGLWNNSVYAELGTYRSLSPSFQSKLGLGHEDTQRLGGNAYWRLAYLKDLKSSNFSAGLFGFSGKVEPDRTVSAPRDKFNDIGVDGSYQFLGTREHIATVNGSYIHERKTEGATGDKSTLNTLRLNASYYFNQSFGGTVGVFSTRGSAPEDTTTGKLFQLDWTPWGKEDAAAPAPFAWANVRLGAQYWMYNKFAGESTGASGNNTLAVFAWTSF